MSTNHNVADGNENPRLLAKPMTGGCIKLGQQFEPRRNAINAWRLILATGVILWHSFPLTGRHLSYAPAHQLLSEVWVDGFFAVSGFLIISSWLSKPRLHYYLAARALRILPGLWVCLLVTAFVIAPISVAIQGGSAAKLMLSSAPIAYVLKNSAVIWLQPDVAGTPRGVPWPHGWDGSLWTLLWEVLCYLAVAGLGMAGLLGRRYVIPTVLALVLCVSALLPRTSAFGETLPAAQQHVDIATVGLVVGAIAARFVVMFLAGALLHQWRSVIPARWSLVVLSVVVVLAASLTPNYRLIAAVPLAYAIIVSSALIRTKRMRLQTDLSYGVYIYAFPVQQLLVICGLNDLTPILFAIIAALVTLPLAALSWFLVEKPAMSLKRRFTPSTTYPSEHLAWAADFALTTGAGLNIVATSAIVVSLEAHMQFHVDSEVVAL
jgi:peptidoglycan/LPS O-acetylase OafA/YrhL